MACRSFRSSSKNNESDIQSFPLLSSNSGLEDNSINVVDLESNSYDDDTSVNSPQRTSHESVTNFYLNQSLHRNSHRSIWARLRAALPLPRLRPRNNKDKPSQRSDGTTFCCDPSISRRPKALRCILYLFFGILIVLGVVQLFTILLNAFADIFPDDLDWVLENWGQVGQPTEGLSHWPTDFSGDITPVACHSHNDYWRKVPLYQAIHAGCIGVEADVWLFDDELFVGHSTSSLTTNRTLTSLYIDPLLDILEKQNPTTHFHPNQDSPANGVFDTDPSQTLILLIDFKTPGAALWPYVVSELAPLRDKGYLTYFNGIDVIQGPITIVGTGNTPFDLLSTNTTYRDIFFDAPLDEMGEDGHRWRKYGSPLGTPLDETPGIDERAVEIVSARSGEEKVSTINRILSRDDEGQGKSGTTGNPDVYNPQNSYYASVSFTKSIGHVWRSRLSTQQLDLMRDQIRGAHRRGLKVRYWDLPSWPKGLRNHVWHILIREGVDILNVDDLTGATRRDWRRRKGWWY